MQIYLVGGAVRDRLLGIAAGDRDWVVVGATPEKMIRKGYKQVGKDFPVFLHPETKEEYALARTERKSGHGYGGFDVHCDPGVTLEEDLMRRDLTINAMAQDEQGHLIDPYGGQADLEQCRLRHVSDAFSEDPLRVLRTARFASRYSQLGFSIADETLILMAQIVNSEELAYLPAERVLTELTRSLSEPSPEVFIRVLRECGALARLLPEVDALFGVPQNPQYHPEVDTGEHLLLALAQAAKLGASIDARFAVLLHDLGKAATPKSELPRHIGHEVRGLALIKNVCNRLGASKNQRELALLVSEFHTHCHRALELRGKTLMKLFNATDAIRRPQRFEEFLQACEADARGRLGLERQPYEQVGYLRRALTLVDSVSVADPLFDGLSGKEIGLELEAERVRRLSHFRKQNSL